MYFLKRFIVRGKEVLGQLGEEAIIGRVGDVVSYMRVDCDNKFFDASASVIVKNKCGDFTLLDHPCCTITEDFKLCNNNLKITRRIIPYSHLTNQLLKDLGHKDVTLVKRLRKTYED